MTSYEPLAAGRATLLAVNNTRAPIGNLCFNTLSITQTTPATPVVPLRRPAGNPAAVQYATWQTCEFCSYFRVMPSADDTAGTGSSGGMGQTVVGAGVIHHLGRFLG